MEAGPDVVFAYDGALASAKRLWALADTLSSMMTARETAGAEALVDWLGPHGDSFLERLGVERTDVDGVVAQFREAATGWAAAWKDAIDQQNRVLQARRFEYNKDHQGTFGGLDGVERPHDPEPRPLPEPPEFRATGGFEEYF